MSFFFFFCVFAACNSTRVKIIRRNNRNWQNATPITVIFWNVRSRRFSRAAAAASRQYRRDIPVLRNPYIPNNIVTFEYYINIHVGARP